MLGSIISSFVFLFLFFPRLDYCSDPSVDFDADCIAQNTRNRAKMCLFGVREIGDCIQGMKFPKATEKWVWLWN